FECAGSILHARPTAVRARERDVFDANRFRGVVAFATDGTVVVGGLGGSRGGKAVGRDVAGRALGGRAPAGGVRRAAAGVFVGAARGRVRTADGGFLRRGRARRRARRGVGRTLAPGVLSIILAGRACENPRGEQAETGVANHGGRIGQDRVFGEVCPNDRVRRPATPSFRIFSIAIRSMIA